MRLAATARFVKAWSKLIDEEKVSARKALKTLAADMKYPSLQVKKVVGAKDIWEARGSRSLRITFQIRDDVVILRNIGHHDEVLKQP